MGPIEMEGTCVSTATRKRLSCHTFHRVKLIFETDDSCKHCTVRITVLTITNTKKIIAEAKPYFTSPYWESLLAVMPFPHQHSHITILNLRLQLSHLSLYLWPADPINNKIKSAYNQNTLLYRPTAVPYPQGVL